METPFIVPALDSTSYPADENKSFWNIYRGPLQPYKEKPLSWEIGAAIAVLALLPLGAILLPVKTLDELLLSGEQEYIGALKIQNQNEMVIDLVDEIPPPPDVANPDFVKPQEVAPPKPKEEAKPIPIETPKVPTVVSRIKGPVAQEGVQDQYAPQMGVRGNPYFPKPPYPYTARQRGAEGICEVKITWSADGRVATVDIAKSSGQRDLDSNTLIHVKGRWHHPDPAKAHPVIVPVVYRMNEH